MSIVNDYFQEINRRKFLQLLASFSVCSLTLQSCLPPIQFESGTLWVASPCGINLFPKEYRPGSSEYRYRADLMRFKAVIINGEQKREITLATVLTMIPVLYFVAPFGQRTFEQDGFVGRQYYGQGFADKASADEWQNTASTAELVSNSVQDAKLLDLDVTILFDPKRRELKLGEQSFAASDGNFFLVEYDDQATLADVIQLSKTDYAMKSRERILNLFKTALPDHERLQTLELTDYPPVTFPKDRPVVSTCPEVYLLTVSL